MCLGTLARIVSVNTSDGVSRPAVLKGPDGTEMMADLAMIPEATPGDYAVIHSGFAISLLTEAEAREAMRLLAEMKEGDIRQQRR
jgi:hydrogenase expression/formation protein HypC